MSSTGPASMRVGFEPARLELARVRLESDAACAEAARKAAKLCATSLGVERVGVWVFEEGRAALRLSTMYLLSEDRYESGQLLRVFELPTYARALEERRAIIAHDTRTDPVTAELRAGYLEPLGITSMCDAPVFQAGELVGVICMEHVGPPRRWTQQEVDFAASVADLAAMILEQAQRLRAEAELRYLAAARVGAQRLELLAQLSGGVAHDLNNILSAVHLAASSLEAGETRYSLEESARAGGRLVKSLLAFFHHHDPAETGPAQLESVVEHLGPILKTLVRGHAMLDIELLPLPPLAIPPGAVEQILLNLCLNARDAYEGRPPGVIRVRSRREGDRGVLEVSDQGVGMDAATLARVWEPYFTTKPTGTGLGLATVRFLATEHGGEVEVESMPGAGTTFRITLPFA